MPAIWISPLLLLGSEPAEPAQAISNPDAAATAIRAGTRTIVPTPTIAIDTMVLLGEDREAARRRVMSYLDPKVDLAGLPTP